MKRDSNENKANHRTAQEGHEEPIVRNFDHVHHDGCWREHAIGNSREAKVPCGFAGIVQHVPDLLCHVESFRTEGIHLGGQQGEHGITLRAHQLIPKLLHKPGRDHELLCEIVGTVVVCELVVPALHFSVLMGAVEGGRLEVIRVQSKGVVLRSLNERVHHSAVFVEESLSSHIQWSLGRDFDQLRILAGACGVQIFWSHQRVSVFG
mmetsp:Transcript_74360/g.174491  ORF Transcript_74360/g.174491 Transcript_74360/m.174491 type:complete len:207 (+) Transcript_74360:535-1155(+)